MILSTNVCLMSILKLKMEIKEEHFRHVLLCYFIKQLSDMYGEEAFKLEQCQNWFAKCITVDDDIESFLELFFFFFVKKGNKFCGIIKFSKKIAKR